VRKILETPLLLGTALNTNLYCARLKCWDNNYTTPTPYKSRTKHLLKFFT